MWQPGDFFRIWTRLLHGNNPRIFRRCRFAGDPSSTRVREWSAAERQNEKGAGWFPRRPNPEEIPVFSSVLARLPPYGSMRRKALARSSSSARVICRRRSTLNASHVYAAVTVAFTSA